MTIRLVTEPDIHLTQSEFERYRREWERMAMFMVDPPSFEEFVRTRKERTVGKGGSPNAG